MIIIDEENDEYKDLAVLYHGDYPSSETDRRYYQMGFYTTKKVSYKSSQIQVILQAFEKNDGDPIYFDLNKSYRGYTERKLFEQAKQDASWSYKLEKASALLNEHIQGELVIFAIQPDGHSEYCHTFEHIGPGEYRHFSYHSLLDFVGIEEKEYQQTREVSMDTILVSGNILKKYAKKDRKTLICWAKPGWIE